MRAIVVDRWMEPSELAVREAPEPAVRAGAMLVDVRAAGCNFFDILMARGQYQSGDKYHRQIVAFRD